MLDLTRTLMAAEVLARTLALSPDQRYILESRAAACERERRPFAYIAGDVEEPGDLRMDWDAPPWKGRSLCGVLIEGQLKVRGSLTNLDLNDGPTLVVLGSVETQRVVHGGSAWLITGSVRVVDTFLGDYNDGAVHIGGDLTAKAVINSDHDIAVGGRIIGQRIDEERGHAFLADGLYDEELREVDWDAVSERAQRNEPLIRSEPRRLSILEAAAAPDAQLLASALAAGGDLEARDVNGLTPLMLALGSVANVKMLLDAGADVDAVDAEGKSVVHKLAYGRNGELIAAVLARRPRLDRPDHKGRTPMMWALAERNLPYVRALHERGVALPVPQEGTGYPYSLRLAEQDLLELLEYLIAAGAKLDWRYGEDGRTLLHQAAEDGEVATVERLVRARAPVMSRDAEGRTPLHLAVRFR